jgi:hypothetical protein
VFVGTSWVKPETSAAIGAMIAAIGSIGAAVAAAVALYFNKRSAQAADRAVDAPEEHQ